MVFHVVQIIKIQKSKFFSQNIFKLFRNNKKSNLKILKYNL